MKTAILAVLLLLLAVDSIVSGAPTESGKYRYADETFFVVILQTLQLTSLSLCLITRNIITYGEMQGNSSNFSPYTRGKIAGNVLVVVSRLQAGSTPNCIWITSMIKEGEKYLMK
jgi:hypothetical protein